MSRRRPSFPETLLRSDAMNLERRLLERASSERPSPELSERMARAIGIPAAGIIGGVAKPGAGGKRVPWHWVSVGLATTSVSGGIAALAVMGGFGAAAVPSRVATPNPQSSHVVAADSSESPVPSAFVPPMAPAPLPHASARTPSVAPIDDIASQIALLDAARAALSGGSAGRALADLEQYESRYPTGSFGPEAAALRIETLAKLGRTAEARAFAKRFLADHGSGPLSERVAREVGLGPP